MIRPTRSVCLTLLFTIFSIYFIFSQSPQERQKITATYDTNLLSQFTATQLQKAEEDKSEALAQAGLRNIPIQITLEDGGYAELQRVLDDGTLIYYRTFNVDAARSTRANHLNIGGSLGLNLDGQNMNLAVWDAGHARVSHQEYDGPGGNNRVTIMDSPVTLHFHAAHVTGTIMASGFMPQAKGMAPRSTVLAYDWNYDVSEATTAAANGLLLSNHSYGYHPVNLPDWYFGAYDTNSRNWDALQYNAPYYLMVVAAGNDGTTNYNAIPLNPALPQYDKLTGHSVSKNTMVVASAQDANVNANGDLISVNISSFSSQGPTDDYRIKPDITGNGHGVYSTFQSADNIYNTISGTSMASPNVSGTLLLLQEHANNVNGNFMRAATLKGLALHTADDAGMTGPDAIFGWGLLHAKRAAQAISQNGNETIIDELVLTQGQTYTITVQADGIQDLMASISWTDPAGIATTDANNTTSRLVNDLDIRVTKNSNTYYPWRLTGVNTNANDGDNFRDPFERVDVSGASGSYTITVTHKGSLSGGSQHFTLIVTGISDAVGCNITTIPSNIQVSSINTTSVNVYWDAVPGAHYDIRFREIGTTQWEVIENLTVPNTTLTGLLLTAAYEAQVRSKCPAGNATAYSPSVFFTTSVYCGAGATAADQEKIANVTFHTINNNSTSVAGYEDFSPISSPVSRGEVYAFSATSLVSNPGDQILVWMDLNQNGDFNDPGEQVLITSQGNSPWTGNITIPLNAEPGVTKMRVRLHNAANGGNANPCGNSTYGQVEDYSVIIYDDYLYYNAQWTPENPSGVATSTDDILVIDGQTSFTGITETNSITILPDGHLNVEGILHVYGDVINQGKMVFVSTETTTSQLAPFTGTFTGEVEVERFIPARRAFRFLSTPVSTPGTIKDNWQEGVNNANTSSNQNPNPGFGTHITGSNTGANGFDATASGNPSLFTLNNATQTWESIPNTNSEGLLAGKAYRLMVRGDRSIDLHNNSATPTNTVLRSTGILHTGTFATPAFNANAGAFNFFGNPYLAAVDMNMVLAAATNVNGSHYYIWDPNMGTRGAFVTVDLSDGTNPSGSDGNQYLQPGQAAFVTTLANGSASLTFQESHKAVEQPLTQVFNVVSQMDLRMYTATAFAQSEKAADGLRIKFGDQNTNDVTPLDAVKYFNIDENLATENSGSKFSMESRALPEDGESIPLFTDQYRTTDYVFEANLMEINDFDASLVDHFTGDITQLVNNDLTLYAFQVDANNPGSSAENRFEIVFQQDTLGEEDLVFGNDFVLFPNPAQGEVNISTKGIAGEEVQLNITGISGQIVYKKTQTVNTNGLVTMDVQGLAKGVYILVLTDATGGQFVTKFIKR